MNKETSEKLIRDMIRVTAILDGSIHMIQKDLQDEEYNSFKRKISTVMGEITWEILDPLYKEYPDLEPGSSEAWQKAGRLWDPNWISKPTGE